jgi:DeoR/GlpR family transcriptional regulator of sugar metabolism
MLPIERRKKIVELIQEKKSLNVKMLSTQLGVSINTVRNDLKKLEIMGELSRLYGGAVLPEEEKHENTMLVSKREVMHAQEKDLIAKQAAEFVKEGDVICLDGSSTSIFLSKKIKTRNHITVITNATRVIIELCESEGIQVICTGGNLRKNNFSYVGKVAEKTISDYYFASKCFFSCQGISLLHGLSDASEEEASIKRKMMNVCEKKIFLCDASKFGMLGFPKLAEIDAIDVIVTDRQPDQIWIDEFSKRQIELFIAHE